MCKRLGLFTVIVVLMFSAIPLTMAESNCDFSYSNQTQGEQFFAMQNYAGALYHFKCALEQDPYNHALLRMIGDIHHYQGDRANATAYYERANEAVMMMENICDSTLSHLTRGWQYYAMGDLGNALEAYRCGHYEEPDNVLYMMELVLVYVDLEDYDHALMYLNRAIQVEDDNPILFSRRGYVHYMNGELNNALIDLNVALELDPSLGSAQETRLLVLEALGQVETLSVESPADKNLLPLEVAPNSSNASVLRQAAEDSFDAYEFEEAIAQYQALLTFEPENAFAHYRIGYAYYALENPLQAQVYLEQAAALNPDHLYTQYFLAMSYAMLDRSQDALTIMNNIYEVYPYDAAFPIVMGHVYRNLGHDEAAAAEFNVWLQQHQLVHLDIVGIANNTPLTLVMDDGVVYDLPLNAHAGDMIQITVESSTLNRMPVDSLIVVMNTNGVPVAGDDDSGALFDAALTFMAPSTGQYTLLVSHAGGNSTGDVKVTVSSTASSADTYREQAQAAMADGDYHRVLEMLDQAILIDGGTDQDYKMRARAYLQLEDYDHAIQAYYRAIELGAESATIYAEIGRIYRIMEDWDSAAFAYSQALEANPMLDYARCQLGMIYTIWGDYDEALQQYGIIMIHNPTDPCAWSNQKAILRLMSHSDAESNHSTLTIQDYLDMAEVHIAQQEWDAAMTAYQHALKLDPTRTDIQCQLSKLVYYDFYNYDNGISHFNTMLGDTDC